MNTRDYFKRKAEIEEQRISRKRHADIKKRYGMGNSLSQQMDDYRQLSLDRDEADLDRRASEGLDDF